MNDYTIEFPLLLEAFHNLVDSNCIDKYMLDSLRIIGCKNPRNLLMTLMLMHTKCIEFPSHYKLQIKECRDLMQQLCNVYSDHELKEMLERINQGIQTRNLFLLQKEIVKNKSIELCQDGYLNTLDLDWTVLTSFSKKKEGAKAGCNKKYKGKPCFQLMLAYLGNIFIDCKLCPGDSNPKVHFIKMVKRSISMGYQFTAVRGDAAFGNAQNVLFLQKRKLPLHYALGVSSQLSIVKEGGKLFKKLAHKGSSRIVHFDKGLSAFDFGSQNISKQGSKEVYTKLIICRRIHRKKIKKHKRKKSGPNKQWEVRYYFYAIATDLDWTVRQIVNYYHQRQQIENGIKELKYHFSLNRLPYHPLKANEFFIASKPFAMTMVKLFIFKYLPKRLHGLRLKTLVRQVLASSILQIKPLHYPILRLRVDLKPKSKYFWHLSRIISKLLEDHYRLFPNQLAG